MIAYARIMHHCFLYRLLYYDFFDSSFDIYRLIDFHRHFYMIFDDHFVTAKMSKFTFISHRPYGMIDLSFGREVTWFSSVLEEYPSQHSFDTIRVFMI